ncbi:hypothetical protein B0H17DRAFT_1044301 [Mycena rosella]|uniref:Uncharacterized protein n=1 Tax=Mycena rosella TaxID=1033263 RepID=A0AAD7GQV9_MYCRO|nr:hypothetical protein B0H17DRAFT_1044301 [Mycena rosella]
MSSPASPSLPEVQDAHPTVGVELERVVSPTPSAKMRFSALQRIKKLGGKLKRSKKHDAIPENPVPDEEPPAATEAAVEEEEEEPNTVVEELNVTEPPEPSTLAQRIRALITSLPTSGPAHPPIKTDPPPLDGDGRPIPPPGMPIKDPKLIKLLSDPGIMNGSLDDGRASVWEALDALDAPKYRKPTSSDDTPGQSDGEPGDDDVQSQGDVMLYCPLHPTDASKVELAHTKIVHVPVTKMDTLWESRWNFLWSVTVGLVKSQPPQTKMVQRWVPSTTKISFQAMWWGYRMYLPPPVMASLTSDEAEAVKIASTITAALTWFLAHIHPATVPVALLPAFLLLQKLGPYVGYIGTFIAWIWGTVQGADKGLGVVLTATWILPVALIPSAIQPVTSPADTPATPPDTAPPSADPAPPATASASLDAGTVLSTTPAEATLSS